MRHVSYIALGGLRKERRGRIFFVFVFVIVFGLYTHNTEQKV